MTTHPSLTLALGLGLLLPLAMLTSSARAQDQAEVAPSKIIGNRELPKVLYFVPWKKPLTDPLAGKPPASVLDEVLSPIDREVFRRNERFTAAATAASAPAP